MTDRAREAWIAGLIDRRPHRPELFVQALTHGSASPRNYERLEFLGDRVLGLVIGEWLLEVYPTQPEGELSTRLNQSVSGEACAAIARDAGIQPHMILGKQARDDGAIESVNVLGDMMEAVISGIESVVAVTSRTAYRRRSAGARSALAPTMAQPAARTAARRPARSGVDR